MRVEAISQKEVKARGKMVPTFSAKMDDGQWYSFGFKNPNLNKGDEVEFEFTPDLYGNKVKFETLQIKGPGGSATVPAAAGSRTPPFGRPAFQPSSKVFPIPLLHGDRSIVRQNALTQARETYCHYIKIAGAGEADLERAAQDIVKLAKIFEAYSAGDTERENVEKEMGDK